MGSVGFVGLGAGAPGRLSLRCSSVGVDAVVGAALRRRVLEADRCARDPRMRIWLSFGSVPFEAAIQRVSGLNC